MIYGALQLEVQENILGCVRGLAGGHTQGQASVSQTAKKWNIYFSLRYIDYDCIGVRELEKIFSFSKTKHHDEIF